MSKINVLSKDIYNKIAAGEVVEKPASIVKELVENSIDAGATSITIEILEGGIKQIKVIDNGCGISYDDFDKVFLAHATSKIKSVDDLAGIATLGFRGEALSSISAVSRVTLSSKTEDDMGYQVKVEDGELGEITPIGATTGTYIIVEDLFYNIPARRKFLRKPKLEENDITNYVSRLILANPNISIKYIADNKIIYQSFGNSLYDAIYSIYGKSIVDNIFEFDFTKGDYKFSGYLGKPTYAKANRTYQTLIINGRYVINQTISTAIYKAFENFLMKGLFPFFVINLEIPLDKVDVNVHPNKLEVKFEDNNQLFGIVYNSILDILYNINNQKTITNSDIDDNISIVNDNNLQDIGNIGTNFNSTNTNENSEEIKEVSLDLEYESNKDTEENISFINNYIHDSTSKDNLDMVNNIINENNKEESYPTNLKPTFDFKVCSPDTENITMPSLLNNDIEYKVVGVLFDTYILIEYNNELVLIDQHAGHERVLFDKYIKEFNSKEIAIQPLLIPYILETNNLESNYIDDNIELLTNLGFQIENFGINSYKVSSVPMLFDSINLSEFFDNILRNIDTKLVVNNVDTIRDYIATSACKAAVKGNEKLSKNEIDTLINLINKPGQVLLCPHGRPISVKVTQNEIEKWFKRIV